MQQTLIQNDEMQTLTKLMKTRDKGKGEVFPGRKGIAKIADNASHGNVLSVLGSE